MKKFYTHHYGFGTNYWKIKDSLNAGDYPTLSDEYKASFTENSEIITYGIVDLPQNVTPTVSATFSLLKRNPLPTYDIYVSGVDKINIEFNQTDTAYFKYELDGNLSKDKLIENRVYTFEYDFTTPIKFIIGNGNREEEVYINPSDIAKKVSINKNNFYYLENNTLKKSLETLEGKYINIYKNKALTADGYIYDLETNTRGADKITGLKLVDENKALEEYTYSGKIIETYYNFSKIISTKEENITEYQTFIKNGKMFVLDGSLDIYGDSVIIDAYNNKEYQTVLGKDGVIYDLKNEINYPEDFKNENIVQMTNNTSSEDHIILLMYESGRVYAFNYINGTVLFDTDISTEQPSIFSTVSNMVMSLFSRSRTALYAPEPEEYEEALELQEKITKTPVEEAQEKIIEKENPQKNEDSLTNITPTEANSPKNNNTISTNEINENDSNNNNTISTNTSATQYDKPDINNTVSSNADNNKQDNTIIEYSNENEEYVTVYDSDTNKYLVYKTSSILGGDTQTINKNPISETEMIEANPELKEYYETATGNTTPRKANGIYLILISISAIGIILIIMYKKKNYT